MGVPCHWSPQPVCAIAPDLDVHPRPVARLRRSRRTMILVYVMSMIKYFCVHIYIYMYIYIHIYVYTYIHIYNIYIYTYIHIYIYTIYTYIHIYIYTYIHIYIYTYIHIYIYNFTACSSIILLRVVLCCCRCCCSCDDYQLLLFIPVIQCISGQRDTTTNSPGIRCWLWPLHHPLNAESGIGLEQGHPPCYKLPAGATGGTHTCAKDL